MINHKIKVKVTEANILFITYVKTNSLLRTLIPCTCVFLPWRGGIEKRDLLRNLAHMLSTCFKQIQREMISQ